MFMSWRKHEIHCWCAWNLFQELERSKFASQALELSKMQEGTKQQEQMTKIKEYEAHVEQVRLLH